jgi:hypothetical protein
MATVQIPNLVWLEVEAGLLGRNRACLVRKKLGKLVKTEPPLASKVSVICSVEFTCLNFDARIC